MTTDVTLPDEASRTSCTRVSLRKAFRLTSRRLRLGYQFAAIIRDGEHTSRTMLALKGIQATTKARRPSAID